MKLILTALNSFKLSLLFFTIVQLIATHDLSRLQGAMMIVNAIAFAYEIFKLDAPEMD